MNEVIRSDLFRYGGERSLLRGLKYPGFRYMYFLRKASKQKTNSVLGLFYKFVIRKLGFKYGFQIPTSTQIGRGFYIGHFGTIVINKKVVIGNNCNIAHSTTIGQSNRGKLKGCPTIGDKVWIGTGAVIVGNITVANNVLIAPNSFVNIDVPEHSIVLGNPAKIISKKNPTEGYIEDMLDQIDDYN